MSDSKFHHLRTPRIHLSFLISVLSRSFLSFFVRTHVSAANKNTGLTITVLYICAFSNAVIFLSHTTQFIFLSICTKHCIRLFTYHPAEISNHVHLFHCLSFLLSHTISKYHVSIRKLLIINHFNLLTMIPYLCLNVNLYYCILFFARHFNERCILIFNELADFSNGFKMKSFFKIGFCNF